MNEGHDFLRVLRVELHLRESYRNRCKVCPKGCEFWNDEISRLKVEIKRLDEGLELKAA